MGDNNMMKLKLIRLLKKYQKEISDNNNEHLKDLIATMVLLDLCRVPTRTIEREDMNRITLYNLMRWCINSNEYQVPSIETITMIKNEYQKRLKKHSLQLAHLEEPAATTWIEMMMKTGMIKEGETIDLKSYVLTDFMSDEKLIEMFNTNGISIGDYNKTIRR